MESLTERREFSERLQKALRDADYSPDSPTQLAREFNPRFAGRPVTVHAARKWLIGEAIPTQEKLRVLAQWLNVPAEWLRFGSPASEKSGGTAHSRLAAADMRLLEDLHRLDEKHQQLAREILALFVQLSKKT